MARAAECATQSARRCVHVEIKKKPGGFNRTAGLRHF